MEPKGQVTGFFSRAVNDQRISTIHICVYMVLIRFWIYNGCENPVTISRKQVMRFSKIRGLGTYHKYIQELHDFGYIRYFPSPHPSWCSTVYLIRSDIDGTIPPFEAKDMYALINMNQTEEEK